ncbi:PadR family transcriptional regulator [Terribacillus saccharophilus]|uniref:PadR family transcriptional regulator n=1 Tax=Terribacillus saccharophilus TaxID=361277 RepID=UPI003981E557
MTKKSPTQYLPLTHTTFYILISLTTPLHGYGIMQKVEEMSNGDVILGPGTLYGALSKLEKQKIISKTDEDHERRKCYVLTKLGKQVVKLEWDRLQKLVEITRNSVENMEVTKHL